MIANIMQRRTRALKSRPTVLILAATTLLGAVQAPAPRGPVYTVLSREGRRPLNATVVAGHEMVSLDDLASIFQLAVREDKLAGGLTVTFKNKTIVLTPAQDLASVSGRLVSLPAPPTRDARGWQVPVEFIGRALALIYETPLELRKVSRLIITGGLRVPRIVTNVEATGASVRVVVDVSSSVNYSVQQEPARLVIRFEADAIDASIAPSGAREVIDELRVIEPGAAIALILGPKFGSFRTSEAQADTGTRRIVIDVVPAGGETAPAPTPAPAPAPAPELPSLPELAPAAPGIRTIVVDPGHGGTETGSRGPRGALEKDITLALARRVKGALEARLGIRVLLTRESDVTVGLDERAAIANNNKADLFISLHANASVRPAVSGAEVFFLSLQEYGDEAQRVAASLSDALPTIGGGSRQIDVIRWEMAQARHIDRSTTLAAIVETHLRARVKMSPRSRQQGPFRVLVGANMPAVLVEAGFLSNPEQEKQLTSDSYQQSIAQALTESVVQFSGAGEPRTGPAGHGDSGGEGRGSPRE